MRPGLAIEALDNTAILQIGPVADNDAIEYPAIRCRACYNLAQCLHAVECAQLVVCTDSDAVFVDSELVGTLARFYAAFRSNLLAEVDRKLRALFVVSNEVELRGKPRCHILECYTISNADNIGIVARKFLWCWVDNNSLVVEFATKQTSKILRLAALRT